MTPREIELMVEIIAAAVPIDDLHDERKVTERLCHACAAANYRCSDMEPFVPRIIERAWALKMARAA